MWLALHLHGVNAFRDELDRMLDLDELAKQEIDAIPGIFTVVDPELTVVAFRSVDGDAGSHRLHDASNAGPRVHVSSTTIEGQFTLRLAFLSHRTDESHLNVALEVLRGVSG